MDTLQVNISNELSTLTNPNETTKASKALEELSQAARRGYRIALDPDSEIARANAQADEVLFQLDIERHEREQKSKAVGVGKILVKERERELSLMSKIWAFAHW